MSDGQQSRTAPSPRRARIGVLGAGVMGAFHARSLAASTTAELVVVADPRPGAADRVAQELGCDAEHDALHALARGDLDGAIVATPVGTHLELIEAAARAGVHVLCEKPLASTLADCQRAAELAREHGVALQVGFHRRFDPDWTRVHEALASGELGQLYLLKSTLRDMTPPPLDYIASSGGYFMDAFIHDFDAARWVGGEVRAVTAVGTSASEAFRGAGDYDNAVVTLQFASGALGLFDGSRLGGYGYDCTTELLGSRATLRIESPVASNVRRLADGTIGTTFPSSFLERFAAAYAAEAAAFARVCAHGEPPAAGAWDALMALAIAQAADRSARRGETVELAEVLGEAGIAAPAALGS